MNKTFFNIGSILLFLIGSQEAFAQFVEFKALPQNKYKVQPASLENGRVQNENLFPFWDDFSQGLDTLAWNFDGTQYSETMGNNAPSLGVIALDGSDENGTPYSREIRDQGVADMITSGEFDLSAFEEDGAELSFFWQAGGKAELPDENDRLILQFLDADSLWTTVWTVNGGREQDPSQFSSEKIAIGSDFLHENFQFRFFNEARLSGPFDTWLIDYILLAPESGSSNFSVSDRALTQPNDLLIGPYGALPLFMLESFSPENLSQVRNEFNNLENRFRAMEYSIFFGQDQSLIPINQNTPFNPVPNALERRAFSSQELTEIPSLENEGNIEILSYLTTGDREFFTIDETDSTFYSHIDFRVNDTVRSFFPIHDYLAYDTGNPDYAAGINQRSGELVVRYEIPGEAFITGISIKFTNTIQANLPIDILVYEDLDEAPVYRSEGLIPALSGSDSLSYFPLDTNIRLNGEFYVGFAQFTNDFIHVGLDKTNDQRQEIFYNVSGAWAQNEEVSGALMVRPHLSPDPPFDNAENPESDLTIYPNPVNSILRVEAEILYTKIYDSFGREILAPREETSSGEIINFTGQKSGIYVLHVMTPLGLKTKRILVN
ncbi:T9SS type A sorting domain-containing protein [Algoriphagus hitonicola]|uniref:Por secretion system C-terminal sorting domain-containing protein n=1 Tax=Algoriphagus hitonicola TaxID=435880 RepID=A0A1I2WXX2_9BACT|nr:T9SS type A sorting domain-containing protein [Algoriphagus hitonicola]SFH05479.1 Por secretion system C-terminal sorting domain-containing protein [Algoriphagus hitonicola]